MFLIFLFVISVLYLFIFFLKLVMFLNDKLLFYFFIIYRRLILSSFGLDYCNLECLRLIIYKSFFVFLVKFIFIYMYYKYLYCG